MQDCYDKPKPLPTSVAMVYIVYRIKESTAYSIGCQEFQYKTGCLLNYIVSLLESNCIAFWRNNETKFIVSSRNCLNGWNSYNLSNITQL